MTCNVKKLTDFYKTPLGEVVQVYVNDIIKKFIPETTKNQFILGLGYVIPYLTKNLIQKNTILSFTLDKMGGITWPNTECSQTAIVHCHNLPIANKVVDRLLIVHGLECCENREKLLKEINRIIAPDGEILIVFPNKAGIWSHTSGTPFAYGEHYTMSQLNTILSKNGFTITSEERFLYFPPTQSLYTQAFFAPVEMMGSYFIPYFSGLNAITAKKRTMIIPNQLNQQQVSTKSRPVKANG
jgi:SAM-dependent methyltransferase